MNLSKQTLWQRFQQRFFEFPEIGLAVDLSRMNFGDDFLDRMQPKMAAAFQAMQALERGAIANPDENRMVGHYWLRNPELAPTSEIKEQIEGTLAAIKEFAAKVHAGEIQGERGPFKNLLVIGIGGSALGTQFLSQALGHPLTDKLEVFFFDNTDPDGMDKVLSRFISELGQTLCLVVSKSGGTKETRNGMIEAQVAWSKATLQFARHAVAVTGKESHLDRYATEQRWLARFPMWEWVGGRTSMMSAVGLLPAALLGFDIDELLRGARECDIATRSERISDNPSAILASSWCYIGNCKGGKDMVVLPYKDRLESLSRYLQQLVMESLGKKVNLSGAIVNQGLSVFGNKGSTDQHAYVQQLRDGLLNFFVLFVEVLRDRRHASTEVEPGLTSGDYLSGFFLGTRNALFDAGRESITLTIPDVGPYSIGVLVALFERAVGLYAFLINVNAYHQPGVEAGKRAADEVVQLKGKLLRALERNPKNCSAAEFAESIGTEDIESVFKILEHLAGNPDSKVKRLGGAPGERAFSYT